jgi:Periplasmic component of the Tol biopolymer transport system
MIMRRLCFALAVTSLCASSLAAQSTPDPEIYLMPLSVDGGKVSVGKPVNITNRPGYDNQPAFSPNGREVYYTSTREDAQADIYRYNIASKKTERVTKTAPESEYSATVMPSHERISVIRVEKDSTQRLWSFALNGSDDRLVLPEIKPVGYHAWLDPFHLALFVLGTPNSLVLVDTRTGKDQVLARDIGRSLLPLPSGHGLTFLSHHDQDWVLTEVRLNRSYDSVRYTRPIVTLPAGMDFVAWVGNTLIGGTGTKLFTWKAGGQWTELIDLAGEGLTHITRIAVSPDLQTLAIVAEKI